METVNIVIINNSNNILRSAPAAPNLPAISTARGNITNTNALVAAINAANMFNGYNVEQAHSNALGLTLVIRVGAVQSVNLIVCRVNSTFNPPVGQWVFSNNAVNGRLPPTIVGNPPDVPGILYADLIDCIEDIPALADPVPPVVARVVSPKTKKYVLLSGPSFRLPWMNSIPYVRSFARPVRESMPVRPESKPRNGQQETKKPEPVPRTNPEQKTKSPRSRTGSPRGRTGSPGRKTGSPRGRTGSPRGRTGSPRSRSASPRGRRGGYYEKYLKYKTKYLALKKELGL